MMRNGVKNEVLVPVVQWSTSVCIHPWYIYIFMYTYTAVNFRYRALNNDTLSNYIDLYLYKKHNYFHFLEVY